jgi:rod shape-determining protein MreD
MTLQFWARLDLVARKLTPFLLSVLLVILSVVPLHIPALGLIKPVLIPASIYYWSIYRPELMPMPSVFILGLALDMLQGSPFGVNAFSLLVVFGVVSSQRRFFHGKGFTVVWWCYMMVVAGVLGLNWLLNSLLNGQMIFAMPLVFSYILSIAIYPVLAVFFTLANKALPTYE